MNDYVINGIYRHYKGNTYKLLGIANHSETLEKMIVYQSTKEDGELWVRPISMWNETVLVGGKSVRRFEYIGNIGEGND